MHVLPLMSTVIPGGHWQKKEPGVLMHFPLMQTPGNTWHSSTSGNQKTEHLLQLQHFAMTQDRSWCYLHRHSLWLWRSLYHRLDLQEESRPVRQEGHKWTVIHSGCKWWHITRDIVMLPLSHLAQGLFQASPSVAQHSDFKVAPLMLTSQRLSTIFSQQVLLMVSVPPKRKSFLADIIVELQIYFSIQLQITLDIYKYIQIYIYLSKTHYYYIIIRIIIISSIIFFFRYTFNEFNGHRIELTHLYTPTQCCPVNCPLSTSTQRSLGCSYSLH